jgi:hypothetical protein
MNDSNSSSLGSAKHSVIFCTTTRRVGRLPTVAAQGYNRFLSLLTAP